MYYLRICLLSPFWPSLLCTLGLNQVKNLDLLENSVETVLIRNVISRPCTRREAPNLSEIVLISM